MTDAARALEMLAELTERKIESLFPHRKVVGPDAALQAALMINVETYLTVAKQLSEQTTLESVSRLRAGWINDRTRLASVDEAYERGRRDGTRKSLAACIEICRSTPMGWDQAAQIEARIRARGEGQDDDGRV